MPFPSSARQPISPLTATAALLTHAILMTNLVAIAASSTVRFWWRSSTYAARWRD
jgi:hypothetical protein